MTAQHLLRQLRAQTTADNDPAWDVRWTLTPAALAADPLGAAPVSTIRVRYDAIDAFLAELFRAHRRGQIAADLVRVTTLYERIDGRPNEARAWFVAGFCIVAQGPGEPLQLVELRLFCGVSVLSQQTRSVQPEAARRRVAAACQATHTIELRDGLFEVATGEVSP